MSVLVLLVLFFAPYQFAFIVTFLVHFFTTVKSLIHAQDTTASSTPAAGKHRWDRYHYHFSLLLVMLCLLPINALILVVWVRNLAVGWLAPFSSDHNVLSVMGFLLNVEALHSGKMLHRSGNGFVLYPIIISRADLRTSQNPLNNNLGLTDNSWRLWNSVRNPLYA